MASLIIAAAKSALCQTAAILGIQASASNQVQLFWQPMTGFEQLQQAATLGLTNAWQIVTNTPVYQTPVMLVTQATTNGQSFFRLGSSPQPNPPPVALPDPQTIAPRAPTNSQLSFSGATSFLYSGSNTVQFGALPGAISPTQAAVLRGRVIGQNGAPLSGVHVFVPNQPGCGYTFTRTNGAYDMAVNGGALVTVDYQLAGYCPVQRQVFVLKQGFTHVPDAILTALDPVASPISFGPSSPSQWATASTQSDASGTRTAKLFFQPGTSAELSFSDGRTQLMTNLTIRVTEFTVGTNGHAAMPALLPPSSHYTYCAEFTADEALAAGAQLVNFSPSLSSYLTNYLGFPVGVIVPNGYYDRTKGVWEPLDNGLVIGLAGISNGIAEISLSTNGTLADAGTLATNGFTTSELAKLASAFPIGSTLWRVPMAHFCVQDRNFPPNPGDPAHPQTPADDPTDPNYLSDLDLGKLRTVRQVFEENVPIVGAPFTLNYSSARVPDYRVNSEVHFPLIVPTPLEDSFVYAEVAVYALDNVQVVADIAGVTNGVIATANPDGAYVTNIAIPWNNSWAYGANLPGAQSTIAQVSIDFHDTFIGDTEASLEATAAAHQYYNTGSATPSGIGLPPLFTQFSGLSSEPTHNGSESIDIGTEFTQTLTRPDHRVLGLGGWSITPQHYYDPVGQILYFGDGTIIQSPPLADSLSVAEDFLNRQILSVAPLSDGSCYVFLGTAPGEPDQIVHFIPNQQIQAITGGAGMPIFDPYNGLVNGASANGFPASNTALNAIGNLITGPDNTVYFSQYNGGDTAIWHIDQQGLLHPVISEGPYNTFQPDGTYGTNDIIFQGNTILTMGPDGSIYYTEEPNTIQTTNASWNGRNWNLIRRLAPDGRIYTVAGSGGPTPQVFTSAFPGDGQYVDLGFGQPASASQLQKPIAILASRDGSIYWLSSGATGQTPFVDRITPTGLMEAVAQYPVTFPFPYPLPSNLTTPFDDDGVLLTAMPAYNDNDLYYIGSQMGEGLDGSIYFSTENGFDGNATEFIWQIAPNGIISRAAGEFQGSWSGIARNVNLGGFNSAVQVGIGSDGTLYASTSRNIDNNINGPYDYQLLNMSTRTPSIALGDISIASQDAAELYVFDQNGHHLRTVDALTGATKWQFSYDTNNLMIRAQDINGLVTTIQRDGSGNPQSITGPYGQITLLTVDANGFLSSAKDPAGNTTKMINSSGGLLQSITGPRGFTFTAGYDTSGRCTSVSDPTGGAESLGLAISNYLQILDYPNNLFSNLMNTAYYDVSDTNSLGAISASSTVLLPNNTTLTQFTSPLGVTSLEAAGLDGSVTLTNSDGSTIVWNFVSDPRFPGQSYLPSSIIMTLPGGPQFQLYSSYNISTPSAGNALTSGWTNIFNLNGSIYTNILTSSNLTSIDYYPDGNQQIGVFDALDRLISLSRPGLATRSYAYDAFGRLASITDQAQEGMRTLNFAYDAFGRLSQFIDALGRTNSLAFDAANHLKGITLTGGQNIGFQCDSEGNIDSVTLPTTASYSFTYDATAKLTAFTPPFVTEDDSIHYAYDSMHNVTNVAMPDGQQIIRAWDADGNITNWSFGSGPTVSGVYSPVTGQLTNMTSTSGSTLQLQYQGFLINNMIWSGPVSGSVAEQFNNSLFHAVETVNGAFPVSFVYDGDLLLTTAGPLALTRDSNESVVAASIGVVQEQRGRDDLGRLTNLSVTVNGSNFWSETLSYNLGNQITNKIETANNAVSRTWQFTYDNNERLYQVFLNGALSATYNYDTNGNRVSRNSEAGTYDAQDRVQTYDGVTFGWSPNGTLRSASAGGQTTNYTYDLRGALSSVALPNGTTIQYVLDPLGLSIGMENNGVLQTGWLYDDNNRPVAELIPGTALTNRFVYAEPFLTPAFMYSGSNVFAFIGDDRGSVRFVINVATGSVAEALDYDEYGRTLSDSNPGFQPFGFAGGLYDQTTGFVHFGQRDYNPQTGSWTARDPLNFLSGSFNLYAYVNCDPVNKVDVSGAGPDPSSNDPDVLNPLERGIFNLDKKIRNALHHEEPTDSQKGDTEEFAKDVAIDVTREGALHLLGQGATGAANSAVQAIANSGDLAGAAIDEATGHALTRAQTAAQQAGNLTGPNSQNNQFNPFPWLNGW